MISQQEYRSRRTKLASQLPQNSMAIVVAAHEKQRNGDAHYRFRQDSDFYYLTGFNEPDAVLLITSGEESKSLLFNRPRNRSEEQWTGLRLGQEGAIKKLGMDNAFPLIEFKEEMSRLLIGVENIYYTFGANSAKEQEIMALIIGLKSHIRKGVVAPECIHDLEPIISELRLFKSESEIMLMRKAAHISVDAHKRAMKACVHASNEYELEAELTYEFSRQGCRSVAYDPIVGGGKNACVLHYTDNNQPLRSGDLVLIDAGGEYENYAADITRTFPVNGVFSKEQRSIYELVLKAQQEGINQIKPGVPWNSVQTVIIRTLTEGLCRLGLLQGAVDELIAKEAYKPFYMHNSGHWLGLDVHDAGKYKLDNEWRLLEAGMVLTVEPGLYISEDIPNIAACWHNIGVRIEDDVLVTGDGHEVLTAALPSTVAEIEAIMRDY